MKRISIIAATLILASCAASTTDTSTTASSTNSSSGDAVTLTLLAHESFTPTEGIFDAFTEQTGIKVEIVRSGDAGQLVTKAALTSGNPEGDVLWGWTTHCSRVHSRQTCLSPTKLPTHSS